MKIKIKDLNKLIKEALLTKYSMKETDYMLPVIMFGELSDTKSHGLIRIASMASGILKLRTNGKPKVIKKTKTSFLIESRGNPGMLVGPIATELLIKTAKKYGFSVVGTKESQSSTGSLTYYAEKIASKNLIGIVMARATSDVAPYGGVEKLFGTNPIAFGIPKKKSPLIFDMSTSAIAYGVVARAKKLGKKLPENVAVDKYGKMTTNPLDVEEGALLTFDNSYKGFGLSMMVEILAGILPGAGYADFNAKDGWGNLYIAIDPNMLGDVDLFKDRVCKLIERVRNSKSTDGNEIRIPGENRIAKRNESLKRGWVEIDKEIYNDINDFIKK